MTSDAMVSAAYLTASQLQVELCYYKLKLKTIKSKNCDDEYMYVCAEARQMLLCTLTLSSD